MLLASLPLVHDERVTRSTSLELRDLMAEEPNGLYTELPRWRSSFTDVRSVCRMP